MHESKYILNCFRKYFNNIFEKGVFNIHDGIWRNLSNTKKFFKTDCVEQTLQKNSGYWEFLCNERKICPEEVD